MTRNAPLPLYAMAALLLALTATSISGATLSSSLSTASANDVKESDVVSTGPTLDPAKLAIWEARIRDVIDNKLSFTCRMLVNTAPTDNQTPSSACSKLRDHQTLMRAVCSASDVQAMLNSVCGYDSIELLTPSSSPLSSVMSSSPLQPSLPPSTSPSLSSNPSPLPAADVQQANFSTKNNLPLAEPKLPNDHPKTQLLADSHHNIGLLSRDSRFSESCNKILSPISSAVRKDKRGCEKLIHSNQISVPGLGSLKFSCTEQERILLHEILCSGRNQEPAHALRGQQQDDVRYVIKTDVSSSCRAALWPLGEGHVMEEAQDSCRTLAGPEGDQLVSSRVCTRQDLDTVLEAVCDAATTTSGHLIALFSVLVSLLFKLYSI